MKLVVTLVSSIVAVVWLMLTSEKSNEWMWKHVIRGGAMGGGGGGQGDKSPPKDFKKGKMKKNMEYFHASKLLKLAFLSSLTRKYVLWKGFYHDFSTKKASASGGFAPWPPPRGFAPWTPEVPSPSLTIYPGAAPACYYCIYT